MIGEKLVLLAATGGYGGWKSIAVEAALNEAARNFEIDVSEVGGFQVSPFFAWPFPPGTPVTILATGSLLVTGYVNQYSPDGDANNHTVRIAGRGRGQDYGDCSCDHPTGRFDNMKVEDIARQLDKFGVGIETEVDTGKPVPWFQVRQGASPHEEMLRLAKQRRLTLKRRASGEIVFTRGGMGHHAGGLWQGRNIERMGATISDNGRFSEYTVKGQSSHGTTEKHLRPKGKCVDPGVKRYRPKVIIDQADSDEERCADRAKWEAKRAAGFSVSATITTPSFRDGAGLLWEPGFTVFVHAPWLKIEQDMLIERVRFQQDNSGGTQAILSLVDPRAYDGESAGSQSGKEWDVP